MEAESLITLITGCMFPKMSLPSNFMHFFHDFIHVYSLSRGRQPIWAKILLSTERLHYFNLVLYPSFHDLINVYSPRGRGRQPQGDKILMSTETSCHFGDLLQVLKKKISLKSDFIHTFNDFIHEYSPRAGADNPLTKF